MPVLPYGPGKSTSAGTGTVTSVSVINANGVSATVATPTTTPAITVALGAITPTSVASTGAVSGTTGTFSGLVTDTGTTLQQIRTETSSDFVASGTVYTIISGLNATMTAGVVYIGGKRVIAGAIATTTFSASLDNYAYINNAASISYISVANGAGSPTLPANSVWLAIIVTGATAITSINQGQIGAVAPVVVSGRILMVSDTNGQLIYPAANQKILGYAQIVAGVSTVATSATQIPGLTTTVIVPAGNRRIKITVFSFNFTSNTAARNIDCSIWDGVVGSGTQLTQSTNQVVNAGSGNSVFVQVIVSPAAGTKTYNAAFTSIGGTTGFGAASIAPAFISVELM